MRDMRRHWTRAAALLALLGCVSGKYYAKIGHKDAGCTQVVRAAYYLTDTCAVEGSKSYKITCSASIAQKTIFSSGDCSGDAESTTDLAVSTDFDGCLLDNGVYCSAECGDYTDAAIRSSFSEEAVLVYEYAQSAGAESSCQNSAGATAVKGYQINYCFGDDGPYSYKCSQLSFTKATYTDAMCDSAGDITGSAQAQMSTCAAGSQVPIAAADANAWVSVSCQAQDFYAPKDKDDDDDDWLTDSAQGQGYLAAAVILGVLCVVLAFAIWKYRGKLEKGPQRFDDTGL